MGLQINEMMLFYASFVHIVLAKLHVSQASTGDNEVKLMMKHPPPPPRVGSNQQP